MPAQVTGDYSKYPESIRDALPYVAGEVCELRQACAVFRHLFMEKEDFTLLMGERLGPLLGRFQTLLEDDIYLTIARLTDKDFLSKKKALENLSLLRLLPAVTESKDPSFATKVNESLEQIIAASDQIRQHRHKRIAHHDLEVSLKRHAIPTVTLREIFALMEQIEAFLNLFYWEFEQTTMHFDVLHQIDITGPAEATVFKALAYDQLDAEGAFAHGEWRRRARQILDRMK